MKYAHIKDMNKGWFVGNFQPSLMPLNECEVALKYYKAGDSEPEHVHKVATEITVVVYGRIRMAGKEFMQGEMVMISPGEPTDFLALEDSATTVVKSPCVPGDKYLTGK